MRQLGKYDASKAGQTYTNTRTINIQYINLKMDGTPMDDRWIEDKQSRIIMEMGTEGRRPRGTRETEKKVGRKHKDQW